LADALDEDGAVNNDRLPIHPLCYHLQDVRNQQARPFEREGPMADVGIGHDILAQLGALHSIAALFSPVSSSYARRRSRAWFASNQAIRSALSGSSS